MRLPLAYHITWTAYGTWLPGDERGWVTRRAPGIRAPDSIRKVNSINVMSEQAVILDSDQRSVVQQTIEDHCSKRQWHLHAVNPRSTHVHVVLTAECAPELAMNQLKSWCSRRLNERWPGRKRWWTYHGSTKWIWDKDYLAKAINYVLHGQ